MRYVLLAALLGAAAWCRTRYLRALEAVTVARRRLGPNGIVVGGEGFVLERPQAPAVLLIHGGGDTPQTLRYLADALHARGFHVSAPLLPGHGRSIRDFRYVTADALSAAVSEEYARLRASHAWVAVVGLSMGGALAVQLAAECEDLPALGLLAPYLAMPPRIERAAKLSAFWGPIIPIVRSSDGKSVLDQLENEKNLAYGVFTAAALRALYETMRRAVALLPRVTAPTLMIQSREDNRISVADGERAFALLGARSKHLEWVTGASHVITVDFGRDAIIARLAAFLEDQFAPRAKLQRAATSDS
ncbi:MAG TPA: alpha/beta fold hydrolase [Gemmatimonadaceae bacterium]